jgi:hypothetical protein
MDRYPEAKAAQEGGGVEPGIPQLFPLIVNYPVRISLPKDGLFEREREGLNVGSADSSSRAG